MSNQIGRRNFLKIAGLGVAGAAALSRPSWASASPVIPGTPTSNPLQETAVDWEEIDRAHKGQVDAFLANIGSDPNFWRQPMEFTLDGDVKVFDLTVAEQEWETEPGVTFPAFTINGMVPGPEIRVTEGDRVRINVTNNMGESTGIHFHGLHVPNDIDGVPFVTQPVIAPGETYSYEFDIINSGSHMYHSHHNAAEQVVRGLLGAFIVEPKDKTNEPVVDADYVMILNDSGLGYTINGKSFPATQPMVAKMGQKIRIRFMNEGLMIHPMHLHGMPKLVIAKDGYNLPMPYLCDTLNIAPGERYDVIVEALFPGLWSFHCHILTHAESRRGLHGMTTVFVVEE